MKITSFLLSILLLSIVLLSCSTISPPVPVSTPPAEVTPTTAPTIAQIQSGQAKVPGTTLADLAIQKNILKALVVFESVNGRNCKMQSIVNTEVTQKPAADGKWEERWTLGRCGVTVSYDLAFVLDSKGNVGFSISGGKPIQ